MECPGSLRCQACWNQSAVMVTAEVSTAESSAPSGSSWELFPTRERKELHFQVWMAARSSILAWRIPQTEETGGLPSMGSQKIRHHWATNRTQHHKTTKLRETASRKLVARGWGSRGGRSYTELQFCKMKIPGDLLHTNANILNTIELYTQNWLRW